MLLSNPTFFFFSCSCPEQAGSLIAVLGSAFEADVSVVTGGKGVAWLGDVATS